MKQIYYYMHYFHFYHIYEQLLSQVNPLDRRSIMRVFILPTVLQGYHVVVFWWVLLSLIFCCYHCCCFMIKIVIILGQNLVSWI